MLSAQDGTKDLSEIISQDRHLKKWATTRSPDVRLGEQSKKAGETSNPIKKAFDWYVQSVDVPGPYGSPDPKVWPGRGEVGQVGKWNDQVTYVTKSGGTVEKVVQRGALATGVAAVGTALAVGACELKAGERILVEGY